MQSSNTKILQEQDYKKSTWTGGTTNQLYIYPQNANYGQRNFIFRISIATTQNEISTFTKLQGVHRVLSILQGKMEIDHKGHYCKTLLKYEIDRFNGEWETTSKGKVTDFNLMLKGCKGDFSFKQYEPGQILKFGDSQQICFIYCIEGNLIQNNESILKTNNLMIISNSTIELKAKDQGKIFYGFIIV